MFTSSLGYGGSETAFLRLATQLSQENDVAIALLERNYGGEYSNIEAQTGLPIYMLDSEHSAGSRRTPRIVRWNRRWRALRTLKKKFDATISFLSGPNLLNGLTSGKGVMILSERGTKRHDVGLTARQRFLWSRILDPIAYRAADWVVAASDGLAGELRAANPGVADHIIAIEGTIHAQALIDQAKQPLDAGFAPLADQATILAIGRLHPSKAFDALLEVFAQVHARLPQARLLIVGDGPEYMSLRDKATALGLSVSDTGADRECQVILAGYREAPIRFCQVSKVFVMPSRNEGLPNALIEGLATGLPMLAADFPYGARSVLGSKDLEAVLQLPSVLPNGVLMPMIDSAVGKAAWCDRLIDILANPIEVRAESERHAALMPFDIANTSPKWAGLCRAAARNLAPSRFAGSSRRIK